MATPHWSDESSLLPWQVDGKWFADSYVLIHIRSGKIAWQVDLLKRAQQAILAHTRKAEPKKYTGAKNENTGSGSAYPEGFYHT